MSGNRWLSKVALWREILPTVSTVMAGAGSMIALCSETRYSGYSSRQLLTGTGGLEEPQKLPVETTNRMLWRLDRTSRI
ncbi:hypothetical protein D3C72_1954990 [compost metagenome]